MDAIDQKSDPALHEARENEIREIHLPRVRASAASPTGFGLQSNILKRPKLHPRLKVLSCHRDVLLL